MRCCKQLLTLGWAFLFTIAASTSLFPQNAEDYKPIFEVFELPGGSPNNQVQQVIQDSSGYLWFASVGGLHRWDGHNFKSYRHDPEDQVAGLFFKKASQYTLEGVPEGWEGVEEISPT